MLAKRILQLYNTNVRIVILLIIVSAFLRFFRLPEFTEFLGDQGMDAMLVYDAVTQGQIPLVGPLSSQGFHQGALYLYFMTPSLLLARFDPLGPSFFAALLGTGAVVAFWYLAKNLFGKLPATFMAFAYAVSPYALQQSRTYWNSFLLPLGSILLLWCFKKLSEKKTLRWYLLTTLVLGTVTQLHYTGLFLLIMSGVLWIALGLWKKKLYTLFAFFTFFVPLAPFLLYQLQNRFVDVSGLLLRLLQYEEVVQNSAPPSILILFGILFQNVIPSLSPMLALLFGLVVIATPIFLRKTNLWHIFLSALLIVSILLFSLYSGDFHVHYMDFLFPIPFLLTASFLHVLLQKKVDKRIVVMIAIVILATNAIRLDSFSPSKNQPQRTRAIAQAIIDDAKNIPFSFTLISSPSFSDLHYRYLLKKAKVPLVQITNENYNTLFLVCEKLPCPTGQEVISAPFIQTLCYEFRCEIFYPKISTSQWQLKEEKEILGGKLIRLERASLNKQNTNRN